MLPIEQQITSTQTTQNCILGSENTDKANKVPKNIKLNYWTPEEQTLYLNFLKQHMPMIASPEYRKNQRIFKRISSLLKTRTPIQVKSHHQKLEDKYKNILKIIGHLEKELRPNGQEKESEETYSADFSLGSFMEETIRPLDFFLGEVPFFEVEYLQNHIHVTFIMEEDSVLI